VKNKFIKPLSFFISCLTLSLLLNVTTHKNNSTMSESNEMHIDELAPWLS
jgi:hypothetical protein